MTGILVDILFVIILFIYFIYLFYLTSPRAILRIFRELSFNRILQKM